MEPDDPGTFLEFPPERVLSPEELEPVRIWAVQAKGCVNSPATFFATEDIEGIQKHVSAVIGMLEQPSTAVIFKIIITSHKTTRFHAKINIKSTEGDRK